MRWLGRLLLLLLLLGIAYAGGSYLRGIWSEFGASTTTSLDDARASTFFIINEDKGLVYPITPADRLLRFYVHAGFESTALPEQLDLTVQYDWLDDSGAVIKGGQYALVLRPRPLMSYDPLSPTQLLPSRFYVDDQVIPSSDEALYLSPLDAPEAVALRLRVDALATEARFVGVRSYLRKYRNPDEVDVVWRRMSQAKKQQLSDASIYPHYLLTRFERNNLLSAYWVSIGPKGAPPDDFRQSNLYLREGGIDLPDEEQFKPSGHYASDTKALTFNIDQTGRYKIVAKPLGSAPSAQATVVWQGQSRSEEWQQAAVLQPGEDASWFWEAELSPGLLQWQPLSDMTVELFQWQADGWVSRTPERQFAKAFLCGPEQPLAYQLSPGEQMQPLQIALRSFYRADAAAPQGESSANYRIERGDGQTLLQGVLQSEAVLDPYRQFSDAAVIDSQVYEAKKVFIDASAHAARLQVTCEQHGLISVYSRPPELPIKKHYPLDHRSWMQHEEKLPVWFGMQPAARETSTEQVNDYALVWYRRPVLGNPEIEAGNFAWTWLDTLGERSWLERQLFSAREVGADIRRESLSATYIELGNPDFGTVTLDSPYAEQLIRPKLIYLRQDAEKQKVAVALYAKPILETTLSKRFGLLSLPAMKSGQHGIGINPASESTQWFLNYSQPINDSVHSYVLRSAYQVDENSVILHLPLLDMDQSISLWFYVPESFRQSQRTLICDARLKTEQAQIVEDERTLAIHQFNFHELDTDTAYALQGRELEHIGPLKSSIVLKNVPQQSAALELSCNAEKWLVSAGLIAEGAREYDVYSEIMSQYE